MVYTYTGIFATIVFFLLIFIFIGFGHYIGRGRPAKSAFDITEGAIFTLMALLVTFTFSGAMQRFDHRRLSIIDEANAIGTAYLRLDMLSDHDAKVLRTDFKDYLAARLAAYKAVPDFDRVTIELAKANVIQKRIWEHTMLAIKNPAIQAAPILVVPAINDMFDIANTRLSHSKLHPPILVFYLLVLVVLLSAFLTGYGMVGSGKATSVHIIAFALITAFTIYVILDLEYPRLGFMQESEFDAFLHNIHNEMIIK